MYESAIMILLDPAAMLFVLLLLVATGALPQPQSVIA